MLKLERSSSWIFDVESNFDIDGVSLKAKFFMLDLLPEVLTSIKLKKGASDKISKTLVPNTIQANLDCTKNKVRWKQ